MLPAALPTKGGWGTSCTSVLVITAELLGGVEQVQRECWKARCDVVHRTREADPVVSNSARCSAIHDDAVVAHDPEGTAESRAPIEVHGSLIADRVTSAVELNGDVAVSARGSVADRQHQGELVRLGPLGVDGDCDRLKTETAVHAEVRCSGGLVAAAAGDLRVVERDELGVRTSLVGCREQGPVERSGEPHLHVPVIRLHDLQHALSDGCETVGDLTAMVSLDPFHELSLRSLAPTLGERRAVEGLGGTRAGAEGVLDPGVERAGEPVALNGLLEHPCGGGKAFLGVHDFLLSGVGTLTDVMMCSFRR